MSYQIHEHAILNSRLSPVPRIIHAHAGGDEPHKHENCGPAFYGYGAPKFCAKPKGEQLPTAELEEWQRSFEIVICDPLPAKGQPGYIGEGPGLLPVQRMVGGFKMRFSVVDGTKQ